MNCIWLKCYPEHSRFTGCVLHVCMVVWAMQGAGQRTGSGDAGVAGAAAGGSGERACGPLLGEVQFEEITLSECVGRGGSGVVYKVTCLSDFAANNLGLTLDPRGCVSSEQQCY